MIEGAAESEAHHLGPTVLTRACLVGAVLLHWCELLGA